MSERSRIGKVVVRLAWRGMLEIGVLAYEKVMVGPCLYILIVY